MLLSPIVLRALINRLSSKCDLLLNHRYEYDGTLIGCFSEATKALRIWQGIGPNINFEINASKHRAFSPTTYPIRFRALAKSVPVSLVFEDGISILRRCLASTPSGFRKQVPICMGTARYNPRFTHPLPPPPCSNIILRRSRHFPSGALGYYTSFQGPVQ